MRYRLRRLRIAMALGPLFMWTAWVWWPPPAPAPPPVRQPPAPMYFEGDVQYFTPGPETRPTP